MEETRYQVTRITKRQEAAFFLNAAEMRFSVVIAVLEINTNKKGKIGRSLLNPTCSESKKVERVTKATGMRTHDELNKFTPARRPSTVDQTNRIKVGAGVFTRKAKIGKNHAGSVKNVPHK